MTPKVRTILSKIARLALLFGVLGGLVYFSFVWERWNTKGKLEPRGGRYFFFRVEIPVPSFRQGDERWKRDTLGPGPSTIGSAGCAVSSAAMVLATYGIDTDPQRLNAFLQTNGGYSPQCWIYWEKAAQFAPDRVRHVYEDDATYYLIDSNLAQGNPVIVRLKRPGEGTHFIVLAGKQGYDYLVRDPGSGADRGLYPLREYGSKIEALRFYQRLSSK